MAVACLEGWPHLHIDHDKKTADLIRNVVAVYPWRTVSVVVLLVLSGLAEGVGVMSLLPMLEAGLQTGGTTSGVAAMVGRALTAVHVQPTFGAFMVVVVAGIAVKAALTLLASKEVGYAVAGVMTDLRVRILEGVFRANWRYLSSMQSGRLANAVGIEAIRAATVFNAIAQLFALMVQVTIYAIAVAILAWQVALAGLVLGAVAARVFHKFVVRVRDAGRAQTDLLRTLSNRVTEMLLSVKSVKAMGCEDRFVDVLVRQAEALNVVQRKQILASESLRVLQEPLAVAVLALGLYTFVMVLGLPLASMMVTAVLFYRLLGRLGTLQQTYQVVVAGESAYWSLKSVADHANVEREDGQSGGEKVGFNKKIAFSRVSFTYGEQPVIRDATFDLNFGEYVCIRGESGVGKSTLGDLLLRLIEPVSGEIRVDGHLLSQLNLRAWRTQVGYVPQEPGLFSGSVYENITLGDPAFTTDDAQHALEEAGAWTFVQALPKSMASELGDRGTGLSGGQRQRIAIARALVRKPKLLILDEVTSSLDPVSEAGIVDTLKNLRGKVTVLAISHQQAVSDAADRELVVENGYVQECRRSEQVA